MYGLSQLDNGLKVVTVGLKDRHSVGLGIWVKAGARFEAPKISGVSHFLEHMLFKGTKNRSTQKIKMDVEGLGGVLNAFTGEEAICYIVKILRDYAEKAFDVLADMINSATLDQKELVRERTVILEEIKMYLDLPSHHVHELMSELLWPDQALGRPIAGSHETVSNLNAPDLRRYMDYYYHPRNLLVSFCGDIPHGKVLALAEHAFGKRKAKLDSKFSKADSKQLAPRFHFLNKKTEQMHFVIGFHALSKSHPARYTLSILNVILGANMSSRLFEEVREKRGLAYEIRSGLSYFEDTGAIAISAGLEPSKAQMAVGVIMKELKKFKEKLVSDGELKRAKDYFMGQFWMGLEDTLDHMLWVGDRMLYHKNLPDREEIFRNIKKVTAADVKALAQKLFKTNSLNLALIGSYAGQFEDQIKNECACD